MTKKFIHFGAVMTGMTVLSFGLGNLPAQAVSLSGNVTIQGEVNLGTSTRNPNNAVFNWTNNTGTVYASNTTQTFSNLTKNGSSIVGQTVDLKDIELARLDRGNPAPYSFNSLTTFIDFGEVTLDDETDQLTFDLDGGEMTRILTGIGVVEYATNGISGIFNFGGQILARGNLSGNATNADNPRQTVGGGTITLTVEQLTTNNVQPIPEPLTILGSSMALGIGIYLKGKFKSKTAK